MPSIDEHLALLSSLQALKDRIASARKQEDEARFFREQAENDFEQAWAALANQPAPPAGDAMLAKLEDDAAARLPRSPVPTSNTTRKASPGIVASLDDGVPIPAPVPVADPIYGCQRCNGIWEAFQRRIVHRNDCPVRPSWARPCEFPLALADGTRLLANYDPARLEPLQVTGGPFGDRAFCLEANLEQRTASSLDEWAVGMAQWHAEVMARHGEGTAPAPEPAPAPKKRGRPAKTSTPGTPLPVWISTKDDAFADRLSELLGHDDRVYHRGTPTTDSPSPCWIVSDECERRKVWVGQIPGPRQEWDYPVDLAVIADFITGHEQQKKRGRPRKQAEPDPQTLDNLLRASLLAADGALARWTAHREQGLADGLLLVHVGTEWGCGGNLDYGKAGQCAYQGVPSGNPAWWFGQLTTEGEPTLAGPALVQAVRRVLSIPEPRQEASEPDLFSGREGAA